MSKTAKLIKDCQKGDTLYHVYDPNFYSDNLDIFPVKIEEIIYGTEFDGGDTYKCIHYTTGYYNHEYTFKHLNSDRHDSLILDTDYARDSKNNARFYTTYQNAVDFLINSIQFKIRKNLQMLEKVEKDFGPASYNAIIKKTKEYYDKEHDRTYKKIEIYDIDSWDKRTPSWLDENLKNEKVKVYKQLIETDSYGSVIWSGTEIFVKEFDSIEEANAWMKENDKSYYHGESDIWFEGERYFIKKDN